MTDVLSTITKNVRVLSLGVYLRFRLILHGSSSMYFFSSKTRLMMGFSTSCKYGMPTAWQQNNNNSITTWSRPPHFHLCDRLDQASFTNRHICDGIKIPWLTFMNCSIALEASELDRNNVFGSAGEAEKRKECMLTGFRGKYHKSEQYKVKDKT